MSHPLSGPTPQAFAADRKPGPIDVIEIIDTPRIGAFRTVVIAMCFLVAMMDGFDTLAIALAAPSISGEWQIAPERFGPLLAIGLFGSVIGAAIAGLFGDRIGRKQTTLASVAVFGVLTFACGLTHSYGQLFLLRLLAGIGLGGALPNFLALTSEYAAASWRTTATTIVAWGFPLGAIFGGLFVPQLIHAHGWQMIFFVGGAVPIILLPALFIGLPESIRFLILRGKEKAAIISILRRIAPGLAITPDPIFILPKATSKLGVGAVLSGPYLLGTMLLSASQFFYQLIYYLLANWIPLLLHMAGLPVGQAVLGTVAMNAGGVVGSFVLSRLMDHTKRPLLIIGGGYLVSVPCIVGVASAGHSFVALAIALFVTGFCLTGAGLSMTGFIPAFYPTPIRSTGVGVSQALARTGSLIGPLAGSLFLAIGLTPRQLFIASTAFPILSVICLLTLAWRSKTRIRAEAEA